MKITLQSIGTVINQRITIDDDHWGTETSEIQLSESMTEESLEGIDQWKK